MKIKPEIEDTLKSSRGLVTMDNYYIGARVMRSHDWSWGDLDGGVGSIGIITETRHGMSGVIFVDFGKAYEVACYAGLQNKYDLIFAP